MKEFRCRACGKGMVRMLAKPGRRTRHRGILVEVPEDLQIPTCDGCGAEWIDDAVAKTIDDALDERETMKDRKL